MQRSLQLQLLSFLAGLSILGSIAKPTFDTILFAVAFVFGTLLMQVRERLERRRGLAVTIGKLAGVAAAWGVVALRAWTPLAARFPHRLSAGMLIAAAVIPTGIFLIDGVLALKARPAKRATSGDA